MKSVLLTLARPAQPKLSSLAGILAQAPAVASAFGRWPGFVLIVMALIGVFTLSTMAVMLASRTAACLLG